MVADAGPSRPLRRVLGSSVSFALGVELGMLVNADRLDTDALPDYVRVSQDEGPGRLARTTLILPITMPPHVFSGTYARPRRRITIFGLRCAMVNCWRWWPKNQQAADSHRYYYLS